MDSRFLRWLVLGFTCLWFGMLVPVHQRGQIQLPGPVTAAAAEDGCCQKKVEAKPSCHGTKESKGQPPARNSANCAVCHFIAGLHTPPPATIYSAYLGLTLQLPSEAALVAPLRHTALPFHGLDPPTV